MTPDLEKMLKWAEIPCTFPGPHPCNICKPVVTLAIALRESMAKVERLKSEFAETDFMNSVGIETAKRHVKQINEQDAAIKDKDREIAALKTEIERLKK